MASSPEKKLFLYSHPVSSYAQKVRIALREKGIPFDFATPKGAGSGIPASTEADFALGNPRVEMPLLIDGDVRVFDSTIILEYLEDKYPEPALLPPRGDAAARARARTIEEVCDTHYEAINWGLGEVRAFKRVEGAAADRLVAQAKSQIAQVHAWLATQLGEAAWFGGESFGWADLCVATVVNRSSTYDVWPEEGGALAKWFDRVKQRPSVKLTLDECAEALKSPPPYADAVKKGLLRREYRDHRLEWMIKSGGANIVMEGLANNSIRFPWPDPLE